MDEGKKNAAWSDFENDLVVADYFDMLTKHRAGIPFVKLHHARKLIEQVEAVEHVTRSVGSIDRKRMNISAVLEELGEQWLRGYPPFGNYQHSLVDAIDRYTAATTSITSIDPALEDAPQEGGIILPLTIVDVPPILPAQPKAAAKLQRLVRKFDPAARDARNRKLGYLGEEVVFHHERENLQAAGRSDLARKVQWTSQELGDGAGYDIFSFTADGSERLIEVKTTNGPARTPFFLSENERLFSEERPDAFRLMRLFDFSSSPSGFELRPPLEESLSLKPTVYRAALS
ncbi:MAG: DUF3883 domain-containing protein [Sphingopyxis sp.]|nr:DUF3883 domain-containing protein [Sphingopyxis sp.]